MEEKNVIQANATEQSNEEVKVVVNCPKCAAALRVREGRIAYVCPVCNTIFRVRKATRTIEDEVKTDGETTTPAEEKAE